MAFDAFGELIQESRSWLTMYLNQQESRWPECSRRAFQQQAR
jgi:hypothetical protein